MKRPWLAYADLKPGDKFYFVYGVMGTPDVKVGTVLYVKGKGGWFRQLEPPSKSSFRTGRSTAVEVVR